MRTFLWVLRHPILVFKIFRCGRNHRALNLKTFKCDYCGKQYRNVSASEYVAKLTKR